MVNDMQYSIAIRVIPATIVLDDERLEVGFNKEGKGTFVDVLGDIPHAHWTTSGLEIDGKKYQYKTLYKPEGALKDYIKELLQKDGSGTMFF